MGSSRFRPGSATARPPLLSEELFRDTLVRERRRADRSEEALGLVLVSLQGSDDRSAATWREIVAAVRTARQDTDVLGWFKTREVLGLILPEHSSGECGTPRQQANAVRGELIRRLGAPAIGRVSVQLCVHPGSGETQSEGIPPLDPLLAPAPYKPPASRYDAVKRLIDVLLSAMLLVLLSPVFLVVAALVKLTSRGPVLFRQERVGQMMNPFVMLKFRTMEPNADHAIHQEFVSAFIASGLQAAEDERNRVFKIVNDPRVTLIGRVLRRTSLDELPQLWNVLRGDMSLVGPRPPLPYEVAQYKSWHKRRVFEAKPGLTGLWQVTGRSRTTFDEMVRLDLRYASTCSLSMDVRILVATPRAVIAGKGAC